MPFIHELFVDKPLDASRIVPLNAQTAGYEVVYVGDCVSWSRRGVHRDKNSPENFPRKTADGVGIPLTTGRKTKAAKPDADGVAPVVTPAVRRRAPAKPKVAVQGVVVDARRRGAAAPVAAAAEPPTANATRRTTHKKKPVESSSSDSESSSSDSESSSNGEEDIGPSRSAPKVVTVQSATQAASNKRRRVEPKCDSDASSGEGSGNNYWSEESDDSDDQNEDGKFVLQSVFS